MWNRTVRWASSSKKGTCSRPSTFPSSSKPWTSCSKTTRSSAFPASILCVCWITQSLYFSRTVVLSYSVLTKTSHRSFWRYFWRRCTRLSRGSLSWTRVHDTKRDVRVRTRGEDASLLSSKVSSTLRLEDLVGLETECSSSFPLFLTYREMSIVCTFAGLKWDGWKTNESIERLLCRRTPGFSSRTSKTPTGISSFLQRSDRWRSTFWVTWKSANKILIWTFKEVW